jgi:hypothetical protein
MKIPSFGFSSFLDLIISMTDWVSFLMEKYDNDDDDDLDQGICMGWRERKINDFFSCNFTKSYSTRISFLSWIISINLIQRMRDRQRSTYN